MKCAELELYDSIRLQWFEENIISLLGEVSFGFPLFFGGASPSSSISQCTYTQGVYIGSANHANFNNRLIYTLRFFHNDLD